ncbi:MAG: hypothetical protein A2X40_08200 [Elusimicrobia bacterium GWC2_65_9]|nr:MAG: hypothetical protein A2X40_08200 [Elusimicrobia bacterium GWC2_65_9]OHC66072.1 MAG: hypothetical protein A2040_03775 [Rhodocyclales bacterium GWA2_65_19]
MCHHRRAGLPGHLKQIGAYGLHLGFFAKEYPETSRKSVYFIPSVFVLFTALSLFSPRVPAPLKALVALGGALYCSRMRRVPLPGRAHGSKC